MDLCTRPPKVTLVITRRDPSGDESKDVARESWPVSMAVPEDPKNCEVEVSIKGCRQSAKDPEHSTTTETSGTFRGGDPEHEPPI